MIFSSPGKVIISGEHAVVYGKLGIAAPVSLFARCKLYPRKNSWISVESEIDFAEGEISELIEEGRELIAMWKECKEKNEFSSLKEKIQSLGVFYSWLCLLCAVLEPERGCKLKVESEIPIGAGMGSSASVSASVAKAIAYTCAKEHKTYEASLWCERIAHLTPSGIDTAIAVYAKPILFKKGEEPKPLKTKFHELSAFLIYTHKPKLSTAELVEKVRKIAVSEREKIINEIETKTLQIKQALEEGNMKSFLEAIKHNNKLLEELGVSSEETERLCSEINAMNGAAAKITGAGGGGIVIAFFENKRKEKEVEDLLVKMGYEKIERPGICLKEKIFWKEKIIFK